MAKFSTRSKFGKSARAPGWWGRLISLVPQFSVPGLRPQTWTRELAEAWVKRIPAKCPFERQIWFGDKLVFYVPPLCPLNPTSAQLYQIRFEAQTYLASLPPDYANLV
jgi:hypothetical protein